MKKVAQSIALLENSQSHQPHIARRRVSYKAYTTCPGADGRSIDMHQNGNIIASSSAQCLTCRDTPLDYCLAIYYMTDAPTTYYVTKNLYRQNSYDMKCYLRVSSGHMTDYAGFIYFSSM